MKRTYLILLLLILSVVDGLAQVRLSTALKQELATASDRDMFRVQLIMADKADLEGLRQEVSGLPVSQRAQRVARLLSAHAEQTQRPVLEQIDRHAEFYPNEVERVRTLWITNLVTVTASKRLIENLAQHPSISFIDLDDRWRIRPIEPVKEEPTADTRSIGGTEPGIEAIGARFLWNLGYTGRNRIAYTLDTGVWPQHPAIGHRFLANHVPLDHAWFPYDTRFPADKTSSHGTHVTGTMVGLDPANADTIGVAFNAYFIASDPVVSNLAFLKPLTDFLYAFEWAIDPDGDPETVNDVPDVINNSWGFDPPADTLLCESVVTDMLVAVELCGIANVFAAGNDGPGPMTIGTPNYVNTGLVNSFTVGALNGNTSTYPIATFSSRGPSPCGGGGSIAIKPEVSAPGVSVRSCVNQNEYDLYSGTSMASPHVAGAVLLLKEAFPFLTGQEVLLALYNSAIDLGDEGEDNTFGMGMINLEAAFNLLSQTHEPVPPLTDEHDLAVEVLSPSGNLLCSNSLTPVIRLHNRGQSALNQVQITFGQVGHQDSQHTWTGTLAAGQHTDVTLPAITLQGSGFTELWFRARPVPEVQELDRINNSTVARFFRRAIEPLPFTENFETVTFEDDRWYRDNPDGTVTWDTLSIEGPRYSTVSAYMNFYTYSPRLNQQDAIVTPLIQLENSTTATLRFDRFYTFFHENFADSLRIEVSTDCGANWQTVFNKGGVDLATHDDNGGNRKPLSVDEWATEYIALDEFAGENILVRFLTTSRKGNHFLMDNILVYSGDEPAGVSEANSRRLTVRPNPGSGEYFIGGWEEGATMSCSVIDMQGREVLNTVLRSPSLQLSHIPSGLYHVLLYAGDRSHSLRLLNVKAF